MVAEFENQLSHTLEEIKSQGLFKTERVITSPQNARISITGGKRVLNMCANNYLGLADHPALIAAAKEALETHGFGMASVRFICGTQDIHKELEAALTKFLRTEETLLYPSCFDANGGLFETLLNEKDAVISDELNHASIIDGIRLCKAQRFRYKHNDMADLEAQLLAAQDARFRLIATDGCFSMDGTIANLAAICDLAEKYNALTMIDDAHATGFLGKTGRGTHEYRGVMGKIDIITGTLGKALGGASGGFTSGRKEIVDLLRQRSRPYLFSNSIAPPVVAASLKALEQRRLRDWFLLSGRAARHRARPHTSLRRTFARGSGICRQRLRRGERRTEITVAAAVSAAKVKIAGDTPATTEEAMLYMVIERFKEGAAPEIYRRFREKGRMMPGGLEYVSSWIDLDFKICWQLMQTEDFALFEQWIANWRDLMDFEIVPVRTSAEAALKVADQSAASI